MLQHPADPAQPPLVPFLTSFQHSLWEDLSSRVGTLLTVDKRRKALLDRNLLCQLFLLQRTSAGLSHGTSKAPSEKAQPGTGGFHPRRRTACEGGQARGGNVLNNE